MEAASNGVFVSDRFPTVVFSVAVDGGNRLELGRPPDCVLLVAAGMSAHLLS